MTPVFGLRCAHPECLMDCLHHDLHSLVAHRPALILYGALDGIYLEDVNDDPDRADEWAAGDDQWLDRVGLAYRTFARRAVDTPMRVTRLGRGWIAVPEPEIPRDMLSALAGFGTDPILWAGLTGPCRFASGRDLAAALDQAPWWIAHGYKEPFLLIGTREPIESMARALDAAIDRSPFRPHRLRAHAKGGGPLL